jgi:hypothetical protein
MRALQVRGEVVPRGSRIESRRVERIVTQEIGELDQLAGIVAQKGQRESVAQRVGGNRDAGKPGASSEAGDPAWIERTGSADSRPLRNNGAVAMAPGRSSRYCFTARRAVALSGTPQFLSPLP